LTVEIAAAEKRKIGGRPGAKVLKFPDFDVSGRVRMQHQRRKMQQIRGSVQQNASSMQRKSCFP